MNIQFSPTKPAAWKNVVPPLPSQDVVNWLDGLQSGADQQIKAGLPTFFPIAFKNEHLSLLASHPQCTHIGFSPLLIVDENNPATYYSSLLAYRLSQDDYIPGGPGQVDVFVGTPTAQTLNPTVTFDKAPIECYKYISYLRWTVPTNSKMLVSTWLNNSRPGAAFPAVDFLRRARWTVAKANSFLNAHPAGQNILVYPSICHCEVDPDPRTIGEATGNFCTLFLCGDANLVKGAVLNDAWRPNWPRNGGGGS